jgi:hypothetical protein
MKWMTLSKEAEAEDEEGTDEEEEATSEGEDDKKKIVPLKSKDIWKVPTGKNSTKQGASNVDEEQGGAAGAVAGSGTAEDESKKLSLNWKPFSTKFIRNINRLAFGLHGFMCLVAFLGRYVFGGSPQIYKLKYDRIHLTGRPSATGNATFHSHSFLQLALPYISGASPTVWSSMNASSQASKKTLAETCGAAVANTLDFASGSQNFSMDMWSYPKQSGVEIDLGLCVAFFFFLSFFFQGSMEALGAIGWIKSFRYDNMFEKQRMTDEQDELAFRDALKRKNYDGTKELYSFLTRQLHFNWWRFVEYTASGSLVLVTVALLSGIVDVELILCIFVLAATCMLLGIVAEFALRANNVLAKVLDIVESRTTTKKPMKDNSVPLDEQHPIYILKGVLDNISAKMKVFAFLFRCMFFYMAIFP